MSDTGPSNTVLIAKFFGMKGREALEQIRALSDLDKEQLGKGLRDETLTY